MSIEKALIAQAQPHLVASRITALMSEEAQKGCRPDITETPVYLEPYFRPAWAMKNTLNIHENPMHTIAKPVAMNDLVRYRVWVSAEQNAEWNRSELFLKQLQTMVYRMGFEVVGNNKDISICLLCHPFDLPVLTAAFQGQFEACELTPMVNGPLHETPKNDWITMVFRDYFPPPPYSHLLTRPHELGISPILPLTVAMSKIEAPAVGLYQALFQAVPPENNWHRNIQLLLDFEYAIKLNEGFGAFQRYAQQSPSGDLRHLAGDVESKAHDDKPVYALALRVALIGAGDISESVLKSLASVTSLFQHGGRPLNYLTEKNYRDILAPEQIRKMFVSGLTHRPGFLVNSEELSGPVHVPPLTDEDRRSLLLGGLETLPVRNPLLFTGTWIGTCEYAGDSQKVCVCKELRSTHTHHLGGSGMGKSSTLEHMILEDIDQNDGVAVIDPHGDMIERLLCLIPQRHVERVIYFNPGDPDWVPIWNPLERIQGQDIGRTANDLVSAIKSFVASGGWGDRLANILRNMIFGLLHLPGGTFLDISDLLRNKSKKNDVLVQEILKVIDNPTARQFWHHDYKAYGKNDLGPPTNKLSKLLVSGTPSLMLSQSENRFNFREIIDEGKILLIDLSNMGISVRQVLGSFILSILHLNALGRRNTPIDQRKQFHAYCDEAHNFLTDSVENLIAEARKYRVSLNLAHQYLSQFNKQIGDALSTVGTSIIYKVDKRDAGYLAKDFQGKVKPEDLVSLARGEAFARIGTEIVKMKTRLPLKIPTTNFRDRIIEESRRQYYKPVHEVKKAIRHRGERWKSPFSALSVLPIETTDGGVKEFAYDEF